MVLLLALSAFAQDPVRLLLVGDSGMPIPAQCAKKAKKNVDLCGGQHEALVGRMLALDPDVVLAAGDLYYDDGTPGTQAELEARLRAWYPKALRDRVIPIVGNHEYSDAEPGAALAAFHAVFDGGIWTGAPADVYRWPIEGGEACLVVGAWEPDQPKSWPDPHLQDPGECAWTVVGTHHVWVTSFDKQSQQRQTGTTLTPGGVLAVQELGRPPQVWLNGHAHLMDGGLYEVKRPEGDFRVLAVTSGTGSHSRCPKTPVTLADDSTVFHPPAGCDDVETVNPGVVPTWVVLEKGFTDVVIDEDVVVITPYAVSDTQPYTVAQRGCWRLVRGASELVPCTW